MNGGSHTGSPKIISPKKEHGRAGIEETQQNQDRNILQLNPKRLFLYQHHEAKCHRCQKETIKQDGIKY